MDTREIREMDILVEEKVDGVAEEEEKSMGDAESIRNLFEQVGRGGRGSLTIDDLCLSVIDDLVKRSAMTSSETRFRSTSRHLTSGDLFKYQIQTLHQRTASF